MTCATSSMPTVPTVPRQPSVTTVTELELPGAARSGRSLRWSAFGAGARAMVPMLVGIVPYGVVVGVTVAESDVSKAAGWATGWTVYSGSAQLAVLELLNSGAAPVVAIAAVLAVNARLLLYGSAMAPHWRSTSRTWRALASYLLVDPSFAVGTEGYTNPRVVAPHAFYLGGAVALWLSWQIAIVVGITAGGVVPPGLQLQFAVPLFLVATVVKAARESHAARVVAVVAAVVAVVGTSLPVQTGLLAAIVVGIGAGIVSESRGSARVQGGAR